MIAKTFEVRDKGTFIPVLSVKLIPACEQDRYLLAMAGYGTTPERQGEYILTCRIDGGEGHCASDAFKFSQTSRTMRVAHQYIEENFDVLPSGSVVDVEFILGDTKQAKRSQYYEFLTEEK